MAPEGAARRAVRERLVHVGVACQRPSAASVVNASAATTFFPWRRAISTARATECPGALPSQNSPAGTSAARPQRTGSNGPP